MAYTNSPLVAYTKLSPNHSGQRTHSIDRITPHCVVGQATAERICDCFISPDRQASCNYGIGTDGRVSLCVEEKNRSWCSSSRENDQRAVTIECASDTSAPYAMNSKVYDSLVKPCTTSLVHTAVSPSRHTATPDGNTAPTPATLQTVSKAVTAMSETAFQAELKYQTAISIAKNLRSQGLLTEEEYGVIDTKLQAEFKPSLGTLLSENDLIN